MNDNLFVGSEARDRIMQGVRKCAQAVGVTMGTGGANSLIECLERPGQFPTNDGLKILESIKLADPLEEMGRKILYEAVSKANKLSGDGSSTTTVLCAAILEEGLKHLSEASPMEIKRSLERCIPIIEESIKSQTKKINVDSVKEVASISAEDSEIGAKIQEIYQQIGKDGIVHWDVSKLPEDHYTIGKGITVLGATYATPYMCDLDPSTGSFLNSARLKNVLVMVCKEKIASGETLNAILSQLYQNNKTELLIFCNEIEPIVIGNLVATRMRPEKSFRIVVVKMPILWMNEWYEDLCLASGAKLVDGIGLKLNQIKISDLGSFENVIVNREETLIDGIKDLSSHIEALQAEGSEANLVRASRLNTKTARYFVGAHSESALAYRRLKVEDAINAAACALENGVVVGGGMALQNTISKLPENEVGSLILKKALQAPFLNIVSNAGGFKGEGSVRVGGEMGFNSLTGQVENLVEKHIVDPADVVLNAAKNAIGVAASILTVGTVVILPREETPQNARPF